MDGRPAGGSLFGSVRTPPTGGGARAGGGEGSRFGPLRPGGPGDGGRATGGEEAKLNSWAIGCGRAVAKSIGCVALRCRSGRVPSLLSPDAEACRRTHPASGHPVGRSITPPDLPAAVSSLISRRSNALFVGMRSCDPHL